MMMMLMIGIGSAVHTTNPMHHPLRRSELCNRIHHKHQWRSDDVDDDMDLAHDEYNFVNVNYDSDNDDCWELMTWKKDAKVVLCNVYISIEKFSQTILYLHI